MLDLNQNQIDKKVSDVTGALSILWSGLKNLKSTVKEEVKFEVPIEEFTNLVEKTLL